LRSNVQVIYRNIHWNTFIKAAFYCIFVPSKPSSSLRTSIQKEIANPIQFKQQLLTWAQQFREILFLDSNDYPQKYTSYDCILAVDAFTSIQTDHHNAFEDLRQYQQTTKDWLFGYLSYDLKNNVEDLQSDNYDGLDFPELFFFQPKKLFLLKGNDVEICYLNLCDDELEEDFAAIADIKEQPAHKQSPLKIEQRISAESYLAKVNTMLGHIHMGDIYEANFCMEFFSEAALINPVQTFQKLNHISKAPFASYFKNNHQYLLCSSPERYIRKQGDHLISQPIKGTAKRYDNPTEDARSQANLSIDPKERSENIMITDLVRNDLSRTAAKGSVTVEELCGLYPFNQVHQMISTISSKLDPKYSVIDTLKTTFPMGSMTGAPKISAMKIIEQLEETKRGLYSGSIGYFTPTADIDFNVVIRSILYNSVNQYVSFSVGSAITSLSEPDSEYQECMLKAKAMFEVLS
jgi:para-aminobenzoate synthetase component 1